MRAPHPRFVCVRPVLSDEKLAVAPAAWTCNSLILSLLSGPAAISNQRRYACPAMVANVWAMAPG